MQKWCVRLNLSSNTLKETVHLPQHVILSEIAVLWLWMQETLIQRFHGPTSSIAGDIQLQRFQTWFYRISATPFSG